MFRKFAFAAALLFAVTILNNRSDGGKVWCRINGNAWVLNNGQTWSSPLNGWTRVEFDNDLGRQTFIVPNGAHAVFDLDPNNVLGLWW